MELIEVLNWRYATKKFGQRKVTDEKVSEILEAINLSASSIGLQPYRVYVVENSEIKKQMGKGSFNSQIVDASYLLVFAAFESITQQNIDDYFELVAKVRETPIENLSDYKGQASAYLLSRTDDENFKWSAKQAYIALGTGLIAAANLQVDATPMEGFDAEKFDTILGLKEKGLKSVVLLALGYRDAENDYMVNMKKVRLPLNEFATVIK